MHTGLLVAAFSSNVHAVFFYLHHLASMRPADADVEMYVQGCQVAGIDCNMGIPNMGRSSITCSYLNSHRFWPGQCLKSIIALTTSLICCRL